MSRINSKKAKQHKIKVALAAIVGLFILGGSIFLYQSAKKRSPIDVVQMYYETERGTLRAYPDGGEELSESMGQYLYYLQSIGEEALFSQAYQVVIEHFLEGDFIKWRTESTSVDALVDTLRIVEALQLAANRFDNDTYEDTARVYLAAIEAFHNHQGVYVDFYDWEYDIKASTVHLSYQNIPIVQQLNYDKEAYHSLFTSAEGQPFFSEIYDVTIGMFEEKEEVHLVDQLLVAQAYLTLFQRKPDAFHQWLTDEYRTQGELKGRYNRETLQPTVEFSSLAVNGLLLEYLVLTGEDDLSKKVYKDIDSHLKKLERKGYENVHIFDYLIAVQAKEFFK